MNTQYNDFWDKKYVKNEIGWDVGTISTPLKMYFDQIEDKNLKILIPGAGNSYEAEYLFHNGFTNVFVIDWAKSALDNFSKRVPDFPKENLMAINFFDHQSNYDLIIEQTFFCAINKNLREKYMQKVHSLLSKKGKLVGLLFNIPLFEERPPFGGNQKEYQRLFSSKFNIRTMETAYNSIEPRKGNELFIILEKM